MTQAICKILLPATLACLMLAGCDDAEHRKSLSPVERCMESVKYDDRNAAAVRECREAIKDGLYQ